MKDDRGQPGSSRKVAALVCYALAALGAAAALRLLLLVRQSYERLAGARALRRELWFSPMILLAGLLFWLAAVVARSARTP